MGRITLHGGILDLESGRFEGQEAHHLTATERKLVHVLWEASPTPLATEVLLQRVWGYSTQMRTRTVTVTIRRLREKLEMDPSRPVSILTVRGEGYALRTVGEREPSLVHRSAPLRELAVAFQRETRVWLLAQPGFGASATARTWARRNHALWVDSTSAESIEAACVVALGLDGLARVDAIRRGLIEATWVVVDGVRGAVPAELFQPPVRVLFTATEPHGPGARVWLPAFTRAEAGRLIAQRRAFLGLPPLEPDVLEARASSGDPTALVLAAPLEDWTGAIERQALCQAHLDALDPEMLSGIAQMKVMPPVPALARFLERSPSEVSGLLERCRRRGLIDPITSRLHPAIREATPRVPRLLERYVSLIADGSWRIPDLIAGRSDLVAALDLASGPERLELLHRLVHTINLTGPTSTALDVVERHTFEMPLELDGPIQVLRATATLIARGPSKSARERLEHALAGALPPRWRVRALGLWCTITSGDTSSEEDTLVALASGAERAQALYAAGTSARHTRPDQAERWLLESLDAFGPDPYRQLGVLIALSRTRPGTRWLDQARVLLEHDHGFSSGVRGQFEGLIALGLFDAGTDARALLERAIEHLGRHSPALAARYACLGAIRLYRVDPARARVWLSRGEPAGTLFFSARHIVEGTPIDGHPDPVQRACLEAWRDGVYTPGLELTRALRCSDDLEPWT